MSYPLVSIVTVVYNGVPYLHKYFDSLLNQTLKEIEIICVNNVSTDDSLALLKDYAKKDDRIIVVNSSENTISGGINTAIKLSKAKYICPVDQDDWVDPDMFKTLINASDNETVDIVCCDHYEYYNESNVRKMVNIPSCIANSTEDIKRYVLTNGGRLFTNIFKKKLFVDNELFYPEKKFYADNAISNALYCVADKIVKIDKHLFYYNVGNVSLTRNKDNFRFFDRLETANMLIENFKRLGLYKKYEEEIDYYHYKLYYKNTIIGCFPRFSRFPLEEINEIKNNYRLDLSKIKSNKYYKQRSLEISDLILNGINIHTFIGLLLFQLYKIIYTFKKLLKKK